MTRTSIRYRAGRHHHRPPVMAMTLAMNAPSVAVAVTAPVMDFPLTISQPLVGAFVAPPVMDFPLTMPTPGIATNVSVTSPLMDFPLTMVAPVVKTAMAYAFTGTTKPTLTDGGQNNAPPPRIIRGRSAPGTAPETGRLGDGAVAGRHHRRPRHHRTHPTRRDHRVEHHQHQLRYQLDGIGRRRSASPNTKCSSTVSATPPRPAPANRSPAAIPGTHYAVVVKARDAAGNWSTAGTLSGGVTTTGTFVPTPRSLFDFHEGTGSTTASTIGTDIVTAPNGGRDGPAVRAWAGGTARRSSSPQQKR